MTAAFEGENIGPSMASIWSLSTSWRALSTACTGSEALSDLMYSIGRPSTWLPTWSRATWMPWSTRTASRAMKPVKPS